MQWRWTTDFVQRRKISSMQNHSNKTLTKKKIIKRKRKSYFFLLRAEHKCVKFKEKFPNHARARVYLTRTLTKASRREKHLFTGSPRIFTPTLETSSHRLEEAWRVFRIRGRPPGAIAGIPQDRLQVFNFFFFLLDPHLRGRDFKSASHGWLISLTFSKIYDFLGVGGGGSLKITSTVL